MTSKPPQPDLLEQLGALALPDRLRRLSDRMYRDIAKLHTAMHVDFNASWYPVLYALLHTTPMTVTQIAKQLRLSHPAINQILGKMTKADLIISTKDEQDERRRLLYLSAKGQQTAQKLEPIWNDIKLVNEGLLNASDMPDLLNNLTRIEADLDQQTLYSRIINQIMIRRAHAAEIKDFDPKFGFALLELSEKWLARNSGNQHKVKELVKDPIGHVINKQGTVKMISLDGYLLGICIIEDIGDNCCELTMLAVLDTVRGFGFQESLFRSAARRMRTNGWHSIIARVDQTNSSLHTLLTGLGFEPAEEVANDILTRNTGAVVLELIL